MKKCPKVFIVIANYNGKDVLAACLRSVFQVDYPDFSVVVVDNNSRDGSLEEAKNMFSRAFFIRNDENLGFSVANNIGIRFSLERGADYVLLLNNDTEVEKNFLKKLIAVGEADPRIGLLSPLILTGKPEKIWYNGARIDWLRMKTILCQKTPLAPVTNSQVISGCAMLVKRKVFKKVGLFDEDYFLYWEDADFSWRAHRAGFLGAVVTQSRVYHWENSEGTPEAKTYWLVISGLIFFKKNTPLWLKPWILGYVWLRKMKNRWDIKQGKNILASSVKKAYHDFEYVRKHS